MENQDNLFLSTIVIENFSLIFYGYVPAYVQNLSCALANVLSTIVITKAMFSLYYKPNRECQNQMAKLYQSHW